MSVFIHVWGRRESYDRAKRWLKSHLPRWVVRLIQAVVYPYGVWRVGRDRHRKIREKLPGDLAVRFEEMLLLARQRWDRGERTPSGAAVELPIPGSEHRVSLRTGSCDVMLYYEICVQEQYARAELRDVHTIVDCGANIGLASAYFLSRYPQARLIALEPDPVNYELCRENLAQFGDRVTLLKMGLWGSSQPLGVRPGNVGTMASTVAPVGDGGVAGTVDGIDMPTLLARYGIDTLDILKIDIEGAELAVFTAPDLGWVDRVRCFQIEPDDDASLEAFLKALNEKAYRFCRYREVVLAERIESRCGSDRCH